VKRFDYADEFISEREIMIAVPSIVIGVGALSFPKSLASMTIAADGWLPILVGGVIAVLITWCIAKMSASFPNQSFLTYASRIVTKPLALVLTFIFSILSLQIAIYQMRQIADISKQYIFDQTPVEVIALVFLLVVIYAVAGSRVGLFRLNALFLPIILFILLLLIVFSLNKFEKEHLFPIFETSFMEYVKGMDSVISSYTGFGILWFYIVLVKQPKKAPKSAAIGMCVPVILYILIFIVCIGVFGNEVTRNLIFPTVELAKNAEIPGEFFERFDSVFFTIWIMAIFNTATLALDVSVFALTSIFKKTPKHKILFILSPIVYIVAMFPENFLEVSTYGTYIGYTVFLYSIFVAILLYTVGKLRGVRFSD